MHKKKTPQRVSFKEKRFDFHRMSLSLFAGNSATARVVGGALMFFEPCQLMLLIGQVPFLSSCSAEQIFNLPVHCSSVNIRIYSLLYKGERLSECKQ